MPRVSVIMSIYQPDERYLREQLASIDAQDFDDMDVIVYNDCPGDERWEDFCHACCTRHELCYVPGDVNRGYAKAFEHLVELADGDYLAFSDQDDVWLPGRVARGVEALDAGHLLACCDRQVIDGEGTVTVQSIRRAQPHEHSLTWQTGEHYARHAATTCYSIGMATMVRASTARELTPFPTCTGHDKWLALGCNTLGTCANIDEPLVQYRQHGNNVTGTMSGIASKRDWYERRVIPSLELALEYATRFPTSPDAEDILDFALARERGDVRALWRQRDIAPKVAAFEIVRALAPDWAFSRTVSLLKSNA